MFGHLGAKVGEQGRKMRQLSKKNDFWWPRGGDAGTGERSRVPHLRNSKRKGLELPPPPGAPNSTWKLVELQLWMELSMDRDTQHVPEGTWRIYMYTYIYIYIHAFAFLSIYSSIYLSTLSFIVFFLLISQGLSFMLWACLFPVVFLFLYCFLSLAVFLVLSSLFF